MTTTLNIGELARATGTNVETIRYYERIGLLPAPPRTASNYRAYSATHVGRLSFARRARDLGFSIEQIRALLDLSDQRDRSCEAVNIIAREHLAEVERKLTDLQALRRELSALIGQCQHGTIAECRIIEALAPGVVRNGCALLFRPFCRSRHVALLRARTAKPVVRPRLRCIMRARLCLWVPARCLAVRPGGSYLVDRRSTTMVGRRPETFRIIQRILFQAGGCVCGRGSDKDQDNL